MPSFVTRTKDGGQIIRDVHDNGVWETKEYDKAGLWIAYNNSKGEWHRRSYNDKKQCVRIDFYNGAWQYWSYDVLGRIILHTDSSGYWQQITYDAEGNHTIKAAW